MNEKNVGSLEACQKLGKAGIVPETEFYWFRTSPTEKWELLSADECPGYGESVPALSMAEAWRELPKKYLEAYLTLQEDGCGYYIDGGNYFIQWFSSINPTDALIYLRIWLEERKEKSHE